MESTEMKRTPDAPHTQWCLVYDATTGAVVHIHQYVAASRADACSLEELGRQATEQAGKQHEMRSLKVGYPSGDIPLLYNVRYRVEPATGSVRFEKLHRTKPTAKS